MALVKATAGPAIGFDPARPSLASAGIDVWHALPPKVGAVDPLD